MSDEYYPTVLCCYVFRAWLLVYLTDIIQGLVACSALCVVGGALGVSDQYNLRGLWLAMFCVLGAELLMYPTKIIRWCVLPCVSGRVFGVLDQEYSTSSGLL